MNELIFEGTIIRIEPFKDPVRRRRWLVTMSVGSVISGSYDGKTFTFPVHSPTKSGLMDGGRYTVHAEVVTDGYQVDEWQWLPVED